MSQSSPIWALLIASATTSCGAAQVDARQTDTQPSVVASARAAPSAGSDAPRPAWWSGEPIETAAPRATGCLVPARHARLALSVDGSPEGVFLPAVSGAAGQLVIHPGGESAARVRLGVAEFDTRLDLSRSRFMLRDRPQAVGGVLHLDERAWVSVIGGSEDRLRVEAVDPQPGRIEWSGSAAFEVACEGLNPKQGWSASPVSQAPERAVYPKRSPIPVRAEQVGPAVASIRVPHAGVLSASGKDVLIKVWLSGLGTVVGWTDAQDWTDTRPQEPVPPEPGGSGMGRMANRKLECATGTRLYVKQRNRLYAVGYIRVPVPGVSREDWDWRVAGDRIRLESSGSIPDGAAWAVLVDDFRITNRFWHDGVRDAFVVPFGPGACEWAAGRR